MDWQMLSHSDLLETLRDTTRDVLPIVLVIFGFQYFVLRQPIHNIKKILIGLVYVIFGLSFFLVGLEKALFPLGDLMAKQLTSPEFISGVSHHAIGNIQWQDYYWVYIFAAAIGFATTVAEPALIAVGGFHQRARPADCGRHWCGHRHRPGQLSHCDWYSLALLHHRWLCLRDYPDFCGTPFDHCTGL